MVDVDKLLTLDQAYDTTLKAYHALVTKYRDLGAPLTATHVFPVLFHLAARAGAIPCPKICKEEFSSVTMAMGMARRSSTDGRSGPTAICGSGTSSPATHPRSSAAIFSWRTGSGPTASTSRAPASTSSRRGTPACRTPS